MPRYNMPDGTRLFTCDHCANTYECDWTDEEAREEARQNGWDPDTVATAIICNDCYNELMARRTWN